MLDSLCLLDYYYSSGVVGRVHLYESYPFRLERFVSCFSTNKGSTLTWHDVTLIDRMTAGTLRSITSGGSGGVPGAGALTKGPGYSSSMVAS